MTYWLVTSTFYGQWLPGDERGSVTNVRDQRVGVVPSKVRQEHSHYGEAYDGVMPGLHRAAVEQLKGPPVAVNLAQAESLLDQFLETAAYRGWVLLPCRSWLITSIWWWNVQRISGSISSSEISRGMVRDGSITCLAGEFRAHGGRMEGQGAWFAVSWPQSTMFVTGNPFPWLFGAENVAGFQPQNRIQTTSMAGDVAPPTYVGGSLCDVRDPLGVYFASTSLDCPLPRPMVLLHLAARVGRHATLLARPFQNSPAITG